MTHRPEPGATQGGRRLRRAVTLSRLLLQVLYIAIALLGALVGPPATTLVLAFAVGVAGAVLFAVMHWSCQEQGPARRVLLATGTTSAALVPFAEGINALGNAGSPLGLGILVLCAVVGGHWIASSIDPDSPTTTITATDRSAGGHPLSTGVAEDSSLTELLRVVPLDVLFGEWRLTEEELDADRSGHRYAAAVHIRGLLLTELHHRDPTGVDRWLSEGCRGRPEHYIRGDHDLTG